MSLEKKEAVENNFKIENLSQSFFALGDLYIERKDIDALKFFKAGDLICEDQLHKILNAKYSHFRYELLFHPEYVNEGIELWRLFKDAEDEEMRQALRMRLLTWYKKSIWDGSEITSLLDIIYTHEKVFLRFDRAFLEDYWNTSTMLFRRSILLSSLMIPLSLAAGYNDFKYLSDVWHTTFLIDCSFDLKNFSYYISKACELDRSNITDDKIHLVDSEKKIYLEHPKSSFEKASILCSKYLYDKNVLELILNHHEKVNGYGWPNKVSEDNISEVENILLSLNQVLSYDEKDYLIDDARSYLKKIVEIQIPNENLPLKRLRMLLQSVFEVEEAINP